jgi:hypothetical protein
MADRMCYTSRLAVEQRARATEDLRRELAGLGFDVSGLSDDRLAAVFVSVGRAVEQAARAVARAGETLRELS